MNWYHLCIVLHILAALLWFGHMFFWSVVVGPVTKRFEPPETGQLLRQLSLRLGGLGWPALCVLVLTGTVLLAYRGVSWQQLVSGGFFLSPSGSILQYKFALIAGMVLYQFFVGHKPAPRLIYANMLLALGIVGLSVILVRAPVSVPSLWSFLW